MAMVAHSLLPTAGNTCTKRSCRTLASVSEAQLTTFLYTETKTVTESTNAAIDGCAIGQAGKLSWKIAWAFDTGPTITTQFISTPMLQAYM